MHYFCSHMTTYLNYGNPLRFNSALCLYLNVKRLLALILIQELGNMTLTQTTDQMTLSWLALIGPLLLTIEFSFLLSCSSLSFSIDTKCS